MRADRRRVMVTPRVFGPDGTRQYLNRRLPSISVLFLRAFGPGWMRNMARRRLADYEMRDWPDDLKSDDVPLASGCCMLCRRAALAEAGGFDEKYFLYFEDYDLCVRLREHGRIAYLPEMRAVHYGGGAARKGWWHVAMFLRSGVRFFRRHGWRWY
jgi:GT2 family glycosyltransferase